MEQQFQEEIFQLIILNKLVGLFINTLPLIVNHENKDISVIEAINDLQNKINEINMNCNVNLANLQEIW